MMPLGFLKPLREQGADLRDTGLALRWFRRAMRMSDQFCYLPIEHRRVRAFNFAHDQDRGYGSKPHAQPLSAFTHLVLCYLLSLTTAYGQQQEAA